MALWAGADLIDMECVQFHPTGMVWPLSVRGILVTEGVRGDGGVLRNSEGKRFMFDYIPPMFAAETADSEDEGDKWYDDHSAGRRPPELLPRDEVARSINSEVKAGRGSPHGGVFLDIATRRSGRVHPAPPPVDVPPVQGAGRRGHHRRAHGGRAPPATTSWAASGWTPTPRRPPWPACSPPARSPAGMHGANRLGGNSLSDLLVFGRRAGHRSGRVRRGPRRGRSTVDEGEVDRGDRGGRGPLRARGRREPLRHPSRPAGDHAEPGRHHPDRCRARRGARPARRAGGPGRPGGAQRRAHATTRAGT